MAEAQALQSRMQRQMARSTAINEAMQAAAQQVGGWKGHTRVGGMLTYQEALLHASSGGAGLAGAWVGVLAGAAGR